MPSSCPWLSSLSTLVLFLRPCCHLLSLSSSLYWLLIVGCCPSLSFSLSHISYVFLIIRCPCFLSFLFTVVIPHHHLHYVIVCLFIVRRLNDFVAPHCPRWCLSSHVSLIDCCIGIVCLVDTHYPRFCHLSSSLMSIASSIDYSILLLLNNICPSFSSFCTTSASSMATLTASLVIWKQHTGSSIHWVWYGNSPLSFWITSNASCVRLPTCQAVIIVTDHQSSIIIPSTKDTLRSSSPSSFVRHPPTQLPRKHEARSPRCIVHTYEFPWPNLSGTFKNCDVHGRNQ